MPIAASKKQTPNDLLASLRTAGLCNEEVQFDSSPDLMKSMGYLGDELTARCGDDGLDITFFPPAEDNSVTVTWPLVVCGLGSSGEDPDILWGSNWIINDINSTPTDALDKAAAATNGTKTSASSARNAFCDAVKKSG
jgi:hypothetical protein